MNSKHFIQKIYYIILLYNLEIVLLFCYFQKTIKNISYFFLVLFKQVLANELLISYIIVAKYSKNLYNVFIISIYNRNSSYLNLKKNE